MCPAGRHRAGDLHGLVGQQRPLRRVHRRPGGAAVRRARRAAGQVLHQARRRQGEGPGTGLLPAGPAVAGLRSWAGGWLVHAQPGRASLPPCLKLPSSTVWEEELRGQRHGILPGLHQNRHWPNGQHCLRLQDRRGVVSLVAE